MVKVLGQVPCYILFVTCELKRGNLVNLCTDQIPLNVSIYSVYILQQVLSAGHSLTIQTIYMLYKEPIWLIIYPLSFPSSRVPLHFWPQPQQFLLDTCSSLCLVLCYSPALRTQHNCLVPQPPAQLLSSTTSYKSCNQHVYQCRNCNFLEGRVIVNLFNHLHWDLVFTIYVHQTGMQVGNIVDLLPITLLVPN